ncbi:MAG: GNAT family N-acetyltransferase [Deltaproteobacteria bacterium]|nr:GNAT family N-acetyltransferase [Deltaproteobacteria bacterium]
MRPATPRDIPELVALINQAYRVEDPLIIGDRTDAADLANLMGQGVFLVDSAGGHLEFGWLRASVFVRISGERGYFGMLAVDPTVQGNGVGASMIRAAEEYCRRAGCRLMELTIIETRTELLGFYGRFGYAPTTKIPFPVPRKMRAHFELQKMEKVLKDSDDSTSR